MDRELESSYPLLQHEQIPTLPIKDLRACLVDVREMLVDMDPGNHPHVPDDEEDHFLLDYLRMQKSLMEDELRSRIAKDRIKCLLSGNNQPMPTNRNQNQDPVDKLRFSPSKKHIEYYEQKDNPSISYSGQPETLDRQEMVKKNLSEYSYCLRGKLSRKNCRNGNTSSQNQESDIDENSFTNGEIKQETGVQKNFDDCDKADALSWIESDVISRRNQNNIITKAEQLEYQSKREKISTATAPWSRGSVQTADSRDFSYSNSILKTKLECSSDTPNFEDTLYSDILPKSSFPNSEEIVNHFDTADCIQGKVEEDFTPKSKKMMIISSSENDIKSVMKKKSEKKTKDKDKVVSTFQELNQKKNTPQRSSSTVTIQMQHYKHKVSVENNAFVVVGGGPKKKKKIKYPQNLQAKEVTSAEWNEKMLIEKSKRRELAIARLETRKNDREKKTAENKPYKNSKRILSFSSNSSKTEKNIKTTGDNLDALDKTSGRYSVSSGESCDTPHINENENRNVEKSPSSSRDSLKDNKENELLLVSWMDKWANNENTQIHEDKQEEKLVINTKENQESVIEKKVDIDTVLLDMTNTKQSEPMEYENRISSLELDENVKSGKTNTSNVLDISDTGKAVTKPADISLKRDADSVSLKESIDKLNEDSLEKVDYVSSTINSEESNQDCKLIQEEDENKTKLLSTNSPMLGEQGESTFEIEDYDYHNKVSTELGNDQMLDTMLRPIKDSIINKTVTKNTAKDNGSKGPSSPLFDRYGRPKFKKTILKDKTHLSQEANIENVKQRLKDIIKPDQPLKNITSIDNGLKDQTKRCFVTNTTYDSFFSLLTIYYNTDISCKVSSLQNRTQKQTTQSNVKAYIDTLRYQYQLYLQWIGIMKDYSTIFSSDSISIENKKPCISTATAENKASSSGEFGQKFIYNGDASSLHYRVVASKRPEVCNVVRRALSNFDSQEMKWEELPENMGLGTTWNLLWTWSPPKLDLSKLLIFQKVNHIPNSRQLTRKDFLKRHIMRFLTMEKMKDGIAPDNSLSTIYGDNTLVSKLSLNKNRYFFDIMPETYVLPSEYIAFVNQYSHDIRQLSTGNKEMKTSEDSDNEKKLSPKSSTANGKSLWIVKPVLLSRGRGISIISDVDQLQYSDPVVVQRYLQNPLLLDGYKFDLRLYVCVTSFQPLEAFLYKQGFGRISTSPFCLKNLSKYIHLTNSSIQKNNVEELHVDNPLLQADLSEAGGTKVSLTYLWRRLEEKGIKVPKLWNDISLLIIKSLVVVAENIPFHPNCFELFGYDVIIEENGEPWLIEVNASPSLATGSSLDEQIKEELIRDTIALIDPLPFDRKYLVDGLQAFLGRDSSASMSKASSASLNKNDEQKLDIDIQLPKKQKKIKTPRNSKASASQQIEEYIEKITGGRTIRQYGKLPSEMGKYERLAPNTDNYRKILQEKRRIFSSGIKKS